jgi:hypothetical protein
VPSMPTGVDIQRCLIDILERCKKTGERIGYPGEGGERRFRYWLATDFLSGRLGWPGDQIVIGEVFDVLLLDQFKFPLQTIETKTPFHRASQDERTQFENRLSGFGTLRHAYFTNGNAWERLRLFNNAGSLAIDDAQQISIESA